MAAITWSGSSTGTGFMFSNYDATASNCTTSGTLCYVWSITTSACDTNSTWYVTSNENHEPAPSRRRDDLIERAQRAEVAAEHGHEESAARAEKLLVSNLSRSQRREWLRSRQFHVRGASGKRYRVRGGTLMANVDELSASGTVLRRLCCHPLGIPICDGLLAQKLMLETDEALFLRTANVHPALAA